MIIPDGYAQVNLKFGGAAAPTGAEMTFGVDVTGFTGDPLDAATAVANAWNVEDMPEQQVDGIELQGVLVKFGPNATGPSAELGVSIPGTVSQDGSPPMVSALISKTTAFGGRAGRGRMFMPGVPEQSVNEAGALGDTYVGNLQGAATAFAANMVLADLPPVLLHAEGSPISTPTPVTNFVVQTQSATQRRRNRR